MTIITSIINYDQSINIIIKSFYEYPTGHRPLLRSFLGQACLRTIFGSGHQIGHVWFKDSRCVKACGVSRRKKKGFI